MASSLCNRLRARTATAANSCTWRTVFALPSVVASLSAAEAQEQAPLLQGTAVLPRDLSPWGMFINADMVVKIVMVGLVVASVVTWTVWLAKTIELWRARRQVHSALGA